MNRSALQVLEDTEINDAWKAEVDRRVAESETGTAITYSLEEVEAALHARLAG